MRRFHVTVCVAVLLLHVAFNSMPLMLLGFYRDHMKQGWGQGPGTASASSVLEHPFGFR